MRDIWDRAVTFKRELSAFEVQDTLVSIVDSMGADGFRISGLKGPFYSEEHQVWILKVVNGDSDVVERIKK